jgi:hypothetical protein
MMIEDISTVIVEIQLKHSCLVATDKDTDVSRTILIRWPDAKFRGTTKFRRSTAQRVQDEKRRGASKYNHGTHGLGLLKRTFNKIGNRAIDYRSKMGQALKRRVIPLFLQVLLRGIDRRILHHAGWRECHSFVASRMLCHLCNQPV